MICLTFSDFYRTAWADEGYELYVLKDCAGAIMYIGISESSVFCRWFGGGFSHMDPLPNGSVRGMTYIGEVIERRLPAAWDWTIELWTLNDCVQSLLSEGITEIFGRDIRHLGIKDIEAYLIKTKAPFYNAMHRGGSNQDPLLKNKLDAAYDRIFNSHNGEK